MLQYLLVNLIFQSTTPIRKHINSPVCSGSAFICCLRCGAGRGYEFFVIVLEMELQESRVAPQCHVMICSRDTSLGDFAENLRYMSQTVSSRRRASNWILSLRVTWESVARQPIILIIPEVASPPEITSNATLELQKLYLRFQFAETMEEEGQTDKESRELQQKVDEGNTHLEQVERELEVVEDELRKVIERRRILMDCREVGAQEIVRLHERQTEIKKR